jgi:hypothetical protein
MGANAARNLGGEGVDGPMIIGFKNGIFIRAGEGGVIESMRLEGLSNPHSTGIMTTSSVQGGLLSNNYITDFGDTGIADVDSYTQIIRNRVVNCPTTGIQCGSGYLDSILYAIAGPVFQCPVGAGGVKLRFNTTLACTAPFVGGQLTTNDNN